MLLEECWFGDVFHPPGAHSDCVQIDGGGYTVIRRCNIQNFLLQETDDVLATSAALSNATVGNGAVICTQDPANPNQMSYVVLTDSLVDGGNYTVYMAPLNGLPAHNMYMDGNQFGLRHRYGPLIFQDADPASSRTNDTWAYTGITGTGMFVNSGDPLPGDLLSTTGTTYMHRRNASPLLARR